MQSGFMISSPRLFFLPLLAIFPECSVDNVRTSLLSFHFDTTMLPCLRATVSPLDNLRLTTASGKCLRLRRSVPQTCVFLVSSCFASKLLSKRVEIVREQDVSLVQSAAHQI